MHIYTPKSHTLRRETECMILHIYEGHRLVVLDFDIEIVRFLYVKDKAFETP